MFMEGKARIAVMAVGDRPAGLIKELERREIEVLDGEIAEAESLVESDNPHLIALAGIRGAMELSTLLEDLERTHAPRVAVVAPRRDLSRLWGLNREVVISLLATEMGDKVVAGRLDALARQAAKKRGDVLRPSPIGPGSMAPRPPLETLPGPALAAERLQSQAALPSVGPQPVGSIQLIKQTRERPPLKVPVPSSVEVIDIASTSGESTYELESSLLESDRPPSRSENSILNAAAPSSAGALDSIDTDELLERALAPAPMPATAPDEASVGTQLHESAPGALTPSPREFDSLDVPLSTPPDNLPSATETFEKAVEHQQISHDDATSNPVVVSSASPAATPDTAPCPSASENAASPMSAAPLAEPTSLVEGNVSEDSLPFTSEPPTPDEVAASDIQLPPATASNAKAQPSKGNTLTEDLPTQRLTAREAEALLHGEKSLDDLVLSKTSSTTSTIPPAHTSPPAHLGGELIQSKEGSGRKLLLLFAFVGALGIGAFLATRGETPRSNVSDKAASNAPPRDSSPSTSEDVPEGAEEPALEEAPTPDTQAPSPSKVGSQLPPGDRAAALRIEQRAQPGCQELLPTPPSIGRDPTHEASLHWQEARKAIVRGDLGESRLKMCTAVLINPESPALEGLGLLYVTQEAPQEALSWIDRALAARPNVRETLDLKATAQSQLGQIEEAERTWLTALSIQATDTARRKGTSLEDTQTAKQFAKRGDLPRAERLLRRAIALDEKNAVALTTLAEVFLKKGSLDASRALAEASLSLEPYFPEAHVIIGEVQIAKGDSAEARRAFERALSMRPDFWAAKKRLLELDKAQ